MGKRDDDNGEIHSQTRNEMTPLHSLYYFVKASWMQIYAFITWLRETFGKCSLL